MTVLDAFDDVELAGLLAGRDGGSRAEGGAVFARALDMGVDPIDVLATFPPGDRERPYRQAARLLGVAHASDIGAYLTPFTDDVDLDRLAGIRSARGRIGNTDILFIAPEFGRIKALIDRLRDDPALRRRIRIVSPSTLETGLAAANAAVLADNAVQRLARRYPSASAHLDLPLYVRAGFLVIVIALVALSVAPGFPLQPLFLGLMSLALAAPSAFRLWAAFTTDRNTPLAPRRMLEDDELPIYSVLIPLRNEAHMVRQIADAMRALDYPPEKLDIKFVVESVSPQTIAAARKQLGDARFSLIVVPRCRPYTKPKALNFTLPFARGEHVVVFDAEDLPDPQQLRMAASLLAAHPDIECLQGELVIANTSKRWIARMFAGEYAGHFGVLLPAIGRAGLPVPLGGTSNHFRTRTLRDIGAWDAFNVTEDADLGIRMARLGLTVKSIATTTLEEAPEGFKAWINQRSRWIKGWMQTLIVHSSHPRKLVVDLGWKGVLAFYVFVGGMVLSLTVHGLFLLSTAVRLGFEIFALGAPGLWTMASLGLLLLGYLGAATIAVIGLDRIGRPDLKASLLGLPFYWLLALHAVLIASVELIVRPYYWSKTEHKGLKRLRQIPMRRPQISQ